MTEEEFDYEKNRILSQHRNPISEEYKDICQEQKEKEREELLREERINEAKELLKNRTGCSIDDIEKLMNISYRLCPMMILILTPMIPCSI